MSDLISRDSVMRAFIQVFDDEDKVYSKESVDTIMQYADKVRDRIKALPSSSSWISVKDIDKLPKHEERLQVTYSNGKIGIAYYMPKAIPFECVLRNEMTCESNIWYKELMFYDANNIICFDKNCLAEDGEIIAFMPLSSPFEPKGE